MVGRVGQFSEVPGDGPTRLLLVGGQDGLALWTWGFVRVVSRRAGFGGQGGGGVGADVLHPLRFAASGYQIPSAIEAPGDDGNLLLLLAARFVTVRVAVLLMPVAIAIRLKTLAVNQGGLR